jgi:hypothetical protein
VLCSNIFKWGQGMASFDPLLADDYMEEVRVTTIFLGMDNSNSDGPPLLFETIITGGWLDQFRIRCTTYEEAEIMHRMVLSMAKREQENNHQAMEIAGNLIDVIRRKNDPC